MISSYGIYLDRIRNRSLWRTPGVADLGMGALGEDFATKDAARDHGLYKLRFDYAVGFAGAWCDLFCMVRAPFSILRSGPYEDLRLRNATVVGGLCDFTRGSVASEPRALARSAVLGWDDHVLGDGGFERVRNPPLRFAAADGE